MALLDAAKAEKLRLCFEQKLPVRAAARVCKCDRKTATRFYEKLKRGEQIKCAETVGLPERVSAKTRKLLDTEAKLRDTTVAALCVQIISQVAKEGWFSLLLDKGA